MVAILDRLNSRAQRLGDELRLKGDLPAGMPSNRAEAPGSVKALHMARVAHYEPYARYYESQNYVRADANEKQMAAWKGLPKSIRPISLIAKRAVDYWPGHVYGGAWTADGLNSSNGRDNRLPYDTDTDEALRLAVQQLYTWANGPRFLTRYMRLTAEYGNVMVELQAPAEGEDGHGKVYPKLILPEDVVELDLSPRGDVISYRLAIPSWDAANQRGYLWGKEVTRTDVRYFYDDKPWDYGSGPEHANPYGFCPAVWPCFLAGEGVEGMAAIDGMLATLDEYQGLLSTINDYIHRFVRQPVFIETPNPDGLAAQMNGRTAGIPMPPGMRSELADRPLANGIITERQSLLTQPVPLGTKAHPLLQDLGLGAATEHIERVKEELWQAVPEIVLQEKLLEMSQVTAPGAMPLVNQVQMKLDDVAANADQGIVRLAQMGVAMAGFLIKNGDWGTRGKLTDAQLKFEGYDLDSYGKGLLDFSLMPRELVAETELEKISVAEAFERLTTPQGWHMAGKSLEDIYGEGAPDKLPSLLEQKDEAMARAQATMEQTMRQNMDEFNAGQTTGFERGQQ